jgi:hypothetical protein
MLYEELQVIFELKSEVSVDCLNDNYLNEKNQIKLLDFGTQFITKLENLIKKLNETYSQLNNLIEDLTNRFGFSSTVLTKDLAGYCSMFISIRDILKNVIDSHRGIDLLSKKAYEFLVLVNSYKSDDLKMNFFQVFDEILSNANEMNHQKMLTDEKAPQEQQSSTENIQIVVSSLDLNIFYEPQRILSEKLHEKYALFRSKELSTSQSQSPTNLNNISHNSFTTKIFLAEVINDHEMATLNLKNDEFILLENVHIVNARHEIMSKSFQSTGSKSITRLNNLVKLTPILNVNKRSEDTYKFVPFIDYETNEFICVFCIKFWHSNQSSLSNTSSVSDHSNNSSFDNNNQMDKTTGSNLNIPIYNPIYFCIYNSAQHLIKKINQLLNDS